MELKQLCEEVIEISREVAHWISQQRVTAGEIESKSLNSLVTFVDKGAERMFVERLSALLPEAGFIAEEGTGKPSDGGFNWIIDPLDGTTNYLHGVPIWCTSVALLYNDTLQLGVICDVNLGEVFSAYHGGGARLNGRAMACSTTPALADALLGTGFPYHDFNRQAAYLSLLGEFTQKTRGIRRPGSAALDLAYVACGRFDGFYEYALQPWDVAAGILIVRESGGRVSGFDGLSDPLFGNDLLATNGVLHDPMSETIRRFMHA